MTEGRPLWIRVTAGVLVAVEALAVLVRGRALLGLARLRPRHGFAAGGLLLILVAVALAVLAGCIMADFVWARIGGGAAQAGLLVGSAIRFHVRPALSAIGVLVEVAVGVLLLIPMTTRRPEGRANPPTTWPRI